METYWQRAARLGQLPDGMQVQENRMGAAGRYDTPNQVAVPTASGGIYGRRRTKADELFAKNAKLQADANAANEARYQEARGLVGLKDPNAYKAAGFATADAYDAHQARLAAEAVATTPPPLPGPDGTPGAEAAARSSRVQAKQRGIYNTSSALNRESVAYSRELADADYRNRAMGLQEAQVTDQMRRGRAAEADAMTQRRLELLYSKNDQAPNLDRMQQVAATEGQGSTEGMAYPMAGGGGGGRGGAMPIGGSAYGGMAGMGYSVPMNTGFYTPPKRPKRAMRAPMAMTAGTGGLGVAALAYGRRR